MYQLYLTEGEYEPWWFFEDWKNLIIKKETFHDFDEAVQCFQVLSQSLSQKYPHQKTKQPFLSAFWNEEEAEYCESCEDDIQIYHGIMLLKNEQKILEIK